jgi:N4-gp56 family major capsid protein
MAAAGVITAAQQALISRKALQMVKTKVALAQFAQVPDNEIIPQGSKSVTYSRGTALSKGGVITEGDSTTTMTDTGSDLSVTTVTGTVVRRAGAVKMSDWSVRSNAPNIVSMASEACAEGAAVTVDSMIVTAMYGGTAIVGARKQYDDTDNWDDFYGEDSGSHPFTTLMKDWLQGAKGVNNGTAIAGVTSAKAGSTPVYVCAALSALSSDQICLTSGDVLVLDDLLDAVGRMQDAKAPYVDGKNYVAILNGRQVASLKKDSSFQGAVQVGAPGAMFNAELQSPIAGLRIVHSESLPILSAGRATQADTTDNTATINIGCILGKGAIGCNKLSKSGYELVYTPAGGTGDRFKELHTYAHKVAAAPVVLKNTWGMFLASNE